MTNDDRSAESVRLYGLPHAERMYLEVADLYESEIDPYVDLETQPEYVVEEWDVANPIDLLPKADWLLEWIEEHLCEEHTHDNDDCGWIFRSPQVLAAAENLRQAIANKVTWHQARHLLAEHKLTFVGSDPVLDGEPIYKVRHIDGADHGA